MGKVVGRNWEEPVIRIYYGGGGPVSIEEENGQMQIPGPHTDKCAEPCQEEALASPKVPGREAKDRKSEGGMEQKRAAVSEYPTVYWNVPCFTVPAECHACGCPLTVPRSTWAGSSFCVYFSHCTDS